MIHKTEKFNQLEGLRGLAAVAVVIHHLLPLLAAAYGWEELPEIYFLQQYSLDLLLPVHNGTMAVWIFWTLSGFVLSVSYFRSRKSSALEQRDILLSSLLRRYPRLFFPVLVSCLVSFWAIKGGLMTNLRASELIRPIDSSAADWMIALSDFTPSLAGVITNSVFFTSTYNAAVWTMPYELIGSVVVFCYLALVGHSRLRWLGYPLLIVLFFKFEMVWLNCFMAGIALADLHMVHPSFFLPHNADGPPNLYHRFQRSGIVALFVFASNYVLASFTKTPPLHLFTASTIIVGSTLLCQPISKFLSARWLVFLGRISFGVYLLHMTIICSFSGWLLELLLNGRPGTLGALFLLGTTLGLCVGVGWLFCRWVDDPSVAFAKQLSRFLLRNDSSN